MKVGKGVGGGVRAVQMLDGVARCARQMQTRGAIKIHDERRDKMRKERSNAVRTWSKYAGSASSSGVKEQPRGVEAVARTACLRPTCDNGQGQGQRVRVGVREASLNRT